jgi:hypothetical protein
MSDKTDISRIFQQDTIVVPAHPKGFQEVFLGERRWQNLKIDKRRLSFLKFIAVYQTAPVSAITHYGTIERLFPLERTGRFDLTLQDSPFELTHVRYTQSDTCAIQGPRYTRLECILSARHLAHAFPV